jgi:hypothetical protein
MTDVRLTALNPVDSQVYPVACNTSGELLVADGGPDLTVTGDLTVDGTASFNNGDVNIDSQGAVTVSSGLIELNGNQLGAIKVTIADNSFAEITPPRSGAGYISIVEGGDEVTPNANCCGFAYADWGQSPSSSLVNGGVFFDISNAGPPDGTTGTDGYVTLFLGGTTGKLYLENRNSNASVFQINFI